jgi:hypothetical protein
MGSNVPLYSQFGIYDLADGNQMVYVESAWSSTMLGNVGAIESYRTSAIDMVDRSLGVEDSVVLMEQIVRELEAGT